ncbi:S-adenosyl-L-methionine-dependent methyltransferase [Parachaetomium inaequale]|uniref:DNA (cytosine-5-)-methyltransferase n=1 Tax=Parachaetomium inaequale TaxID=2588326 RepID=A0AAN6PR71_9PEZI|nr:S-adenosyl-L-methionine-dependent methyltransferase [Parachaetomium inaequale]
MAYLINGALGAPYNPVPIEDDDDDDDYGHIARRTRRIEEEARTGRQLAALVASRNAHRASHDGYGSPSQSDDLDREFQIEAVLEADIAEVIDLTGDDDFPPIPARAPTVPRDRVREVRSHELPNGIRLQPGTTVELKQPLPRFGVEFLRLTSIIKSGWDQDVTLRGLGFARTRQLGGMLPSQLNEVAMVAEVSNSSGRQWVEEAMIDVKPSDILCVRELRITNALFPDHRFSRSDFEEKGKRWVEKHAPLVCRYRYHVHYNGSNEKPCEWAFVRICERESDPKYKTMDDKNINRWRGGKVLGGSHNPAGLGHPVCDLETEPSSHVRALNPSPQQRYTAGDVFSGAGGASRGIERAGLKLMFAVDHWAPAVASLRRNFPHSRIHDMDVFDFITAKDTGCKVDILHLSPPCQFWSPAHTVAGRNDEDNIAVLFSCTDLIKKHRPRLFTVEQTFGILSPKFQEFFNLFLQGFTKFGYSVRWKVLPLANYGVPQTRRRLIMIGSAPGEKLPPFPPPTHNKDGTGGLKPWATPKSVLASLPRGLVHKLHQPHNIKRYDPPKRRWNADTLARTITTNGGQNYHWTGRRDFTLLEYAVLQGFPTWHKFEGSYVKKQIGNAFAPSVVKVLYDHLVDWLLEQDGFDPASARRKNSRAGLPADLSPDAYIRLDDNDEDDNGTPSAQRNVRDLNRAAKQELNQDNDTDMMDLDGLDALSDTETLRDGEGPPEGGEHHGRWDVMEMMDVDMVRAGEEGVIDLTVDRGRGTAEDPCVLSD